MEMQQEVDPSPLPDGNKVKLKRRSLSLREKLEIIEEIESGKDRHLLSSERGLPRSTIFSIWTTRNKIKSANAIHGRSDGCKRLRPSGYDAVDQALYRWWLHARNRDMNISTSVLIEKATSFAVSLGVQFKNTGSWMDRFKSRHGIKVSHAGKSEMSVPQDHRNDSFVKELPYLTRGRSYHDIYCVNEIGLFYNVLPDENQIIGGSDRVGCDKRVTLLLGSNMDGSDSLPPLVIGNCEALCGFQTTESLSVSYVYNTSSYLTAQIWHDWITAFDKKMYALRRRVILFSDTCPFNFTVATLKAVSVKFVPESSVSFMPIKQGIMQRFKTWYRKLVLRDMIESINDGIHFHLDMLSVLHFVRKAWEHISKDCVLNSYKVAGWTWDDAYGDQIHFSEPSPSISHECMKLNISESIFYEIDKLEDSMRTQEEVTDQIIVESVASQSGMFSLESIEETDSDVMADLMKANGLCSSSNNVSDDVIFHSNGFNQLYSTESVKPGLSDAKNALQTLQAYLASVEKESLKPRPPVRKRKGRPRKKVVEKGKVMSLNPEKGVFEMTVTKIIKNEDEDIDLHMQC